MNRILLTPLILPVVIGQISAAIISVGAGSYSTSLPSGKIGPSTSQGVAALPAVTADVTGAIPTNDWGSSIAFKRSPDNQFSNTMYPHPLGMECGASGLAIGYGNESYSGDNFYSYGLPRDFTVGYSGINAAQTRLGGYSDWMQTADWNNGGMRATFGHGMPFVFFEYATPGALITCSGTPVVWYNNNGVLGMSVGSRNYGIFGPSGTAWTMSGTSISSNLNSKTYLSVAVLPDNDEATLLMFKNHAYAFVTDSRVTWDFDPATSIVTTDFTLTTALKEGTENSSMQAMYYHQWKNSATPTTGKTYVSTAGEMRLVEGNHFQTKTPFTGILPALPWPSGSPDFSAATLNGYLDDMKNTPDATLIRTGADTYWTGKELGRAALLAEIANQAGNTAARDRFVNLIKGRLEEWLTAEEGEATELFCHENLWGSLIGFGDSYGSMDELNDHHFHYGYFIQAAALVAKFDKEWASTDNWGGMVELIIKEVSNTERGEDFSPFLRTFDPYAGHSWAAGHANFGDGNNQESTSEALNYSAAVAMWGMVTGNTELRDLGAFLYATEVTAFKSYWQDVDNEVFPEAFAKTALGMVWGGKGDHATWFTGEPEMIHGINMLPITGASLYLGHSPSYVQSNYDEVVAENGGSPVQWRDILWQFLAFVNPQEAVDLFSGDDGYTPEEGDSKAHAYHHIHALASYGNVDESVSCDNPSFAVFDKNGAKSYAVWNYQSTPITAKFSDGNWFEVPADTFRIFSESEAVAIGAPAVSKTIGAPSIRDLGTMIQIAGLQGTSPEVSFYALNGSRIKTMRIGTDAMRPLLISKEAAGLAASGSYIVSVKSEQGNFTKSFIVQ